MEKCRHFCSDTKKDKLENKEYKLVSYKELPGYMKDNEFIHKYYRVEWPFKQAFFSLFQWHNETINVWSHLLGFLLFVGLTIANAAHVSQTADLFGIFRTSSTGSYKNTSHGSINLLMGMPKMMDLNSLPNQGDIEPAARWPFFVYLCGSMYCLLSSSICHLFGCHSHDTNLLLLQMDYTGITVMIITSFFPAIYYIFLCQPIWQIVYLSGISIFGAFTIATMLSPTLSSGKCRSFRAILFVSMGLFGIIPATHACILNWDNPRRNLTLAYESVMAFSYLIGTGFYVTRVPERWWPGWFDLAGHSHQIFHVFVLLGALAHYGAALLFMEYRDMVGCGQ
ncbi:heptahelical transmembrane protein ADIPOR1-like [Amaranthus tricolor]|uniref:heptahelical transmembrane protein ADIPOR1-like n=1 Tax=Amaranthus tricolor TaxID=29722 RepID=UPI002588DA90|nr:heptahelical transmembrane protein ADIPOR1-like [Amaranthus tricolor]